MSRAALAPLLLLQLLLIAGCGGPLEGERVREPVSDWSFLRGAGDVEVATAQGRRFRFARPLPLTHEGGLYLVVSTIFARSDGALDAVLAGEGVELRAGGRVYALRAVRLETAEEIDPLLPTLLRETAHIEGTGLRWNPQPERYPDTQMRQWFFRLEPDLQGSG